ncbi:helix-turn-helix domain-containing protein [Amycolatopsis sp. cmx-11-51]|uniref:helix-turn-helix domain-containing protein n=1 Tax=Amycolatopsis sp. cmx-11-51 TaxID=2785797 RepID=UPI0039E72899
MRRAWERLHREYATDLLVSSLAADVELSSFQFNRRFAACYGETPGRLLKRVRMEWAQFLLRHSRYPVRRIGRSVGYRSPGTFSDRFHKYVGCSPSEYRARHFVEVSGSWAPWYIATPRDPRAPTS